MSTLLICQTFQIKLFIVNQRKFDTCTLLAVVLKVIKGDLYHLGTKAVEKLLSFHSVSLSSHYAKNIF